MQDAKKLLSSSLIVFVGTIVASFFSYLFNMLMGRLLGPSAYGDMMTVMSASAIFLVAAGAIVTIVMMYSSQLYAEKNTAALSKLIKVFSSYLLFFGVFFFLLTLIFSSRVASIFSISNNLFVVFGFSSVVIGLLISVNRGFLQGVQKFVPLSFIGIFEMISRLVLALVAVKIGFGVGGAILASVIATVLAYLVSFGSIKKVLAQKDESGKDFVFNKREILSFAIPTFFASLMLAISVNVDILLVKQFFNPHDAGIYAGISTVGKIILYLVAPIIGVMFPIITEKRAKGEKHYKTLLLAAFLTTVSSIIILAVYAIAPTFVINLLYGSKFTEASYLLPQVGMFVITYTLINLFCNYFIAVKDFAFVFFYLFIVIIQITVVQFYHPSIAVVIKVFILSNAILFLLLSVYYLFTKREQIMAMIRAQYEG